MQIDRNNYEAYLIDYLEGTLDEAMMQAVRAFLLKNPDIAEELEGMEEAVVQPEMHAIIDTSALQRSFSDVPEITTENYEEFCIAWHEGDLDKQSQSDLQTYIDEHPEAANTFKLYKAMHFEVDTKVQFRNKKNLLQPIAMPLYTRYRWAIGTAAALLISIGIYIRFNSDPSHSTTPILAEQTHTEVAPSVVQQDVSFDEPKEEKRIRIFINPVREVKEEQPHPIRSNTQLAQLQPIQAQLSVSTTIEKPTPWIHTAPVSQPSEAKSPAGILQRVPRLSQLARRNTSREDLLWEAMNAGVRGYNRLTENQLALNTARNDAGKLTEFALHAGKFELSRSMKRNDIN